MATLEPVDVLIVGAGASGGAIAWSLADTRMRIVCLEQGDWVKPTDFPSNGRDWEARQFGDFSVSPNIRRNAADYPINEDDSPIKVANFNGVGGGTVLYAGHFPRMHPSDFKVRASSRPLSPIGSGGICGCLAGYAGSPARPEMPIILSFSAK